MQMMQEKLRIEFMNGNLNLKISKIPIIKWLIIGLLTVFTLQLQAQEIKTKQDAINNLNTTLRVSYDWSISINEKSTSPDGVEQFSHYIADNYSLEHEYLLINLAIYEYDSNLKSMVKVGKTKQLAVNLLGEFTLENTGYKPAKYPSYLMKYKNYFFSNSRIDIPVPGQTWTKSDYSARINTKKLYESIMFLKSTYDPNEAGDLKLSNFKDEFIKAGKSKEINEEQRKYIVQANASNDAKDYKNALLLYRKALDVDKFSYPDAYFNMALILSQLEHYYQAIYAMKEYLILAPESEDARKAQDKIYEWEINIKN
jgi:hypothetical protein